MRIWIGTFVFIIAIIHIVDGQIRKPIRDSIQVYRSEKKIARLISFLEYNLRRNRSQKKNSLEEQFFLRQELGDAYRKAGKFQSADSIYSLNAQYSDQDGKIDYFQISNVWFSRAVVAIRRSDFPSAESHFTRCLEFQKKVPKLDTEVEANTNFWLGNLYYKMGKNGEAKKFYLQSLQKSMEDSLRLEIFHSLGSLYSDLGQLSMADSIYSIANQIISQKVDTLDANFGRHFTHLGILQERLGNYDRAIWYFNRARLNTEFHFGKIHSEVADVYTNLGVIALEKQDINQAMTYMENAISIRSKLHLDNDLNTGVVIFNLGNIFYSKGLIRRARANFLDAQSIFQQFLPPDHQEFADIYNNLAAVEMRLGNGDSALKYYEKTISILEKNFGSEHILTALAHHRKGVLLFQLAKWEEAKVEFLIFENIILSLVRNYFPYLSSEEQENFLDKYQSYLDIFKAFCFQAQIIFPELKEYLLQHQVLTKGLLLQNAQSRKLTLMSSRDTTVEHYYSKWLDKKKLIYQSLTNLTEGAKLEELRSEADELEKMLVRLTPHFFQTKVPSFRNLTMALDKESALVETIRVPVFGIQSWEMDSSFADPFRYPVWALTDSVRYVSMVVKRDGAGPDLVDMGSGKLLDGKYFFDYQKQIKRLQDDTVSYDRFWGSLEATLKGSRKVYFSPDGVYYKLNINTLKSSKTKKFLADMWETRRLTNPSDILGFSESKRSKNPWVLVGNPDFNRLDSTGKKPLIFDSGEWVPLAQTEKEVKNIQKLLHSNGIASQLFTGPNATENQIKEIRSPQVLHISTHGFFQHHHDGKHGRLFNSGLVFAGANKMGSGYEDGIFTAFEAMNLDLTGTELLVLSACETGLGEIKNGEGVFGLQRAFKVAGARCILMSQWKISDLATRELMDSFYGYLLKPSPSDYKTTGGKERSSEIRAPRIHWAFNMAQKEIRKKYPNPYFWGAFVLVGE